MVKPDTTLKKE